MIKDDEALREFLVESAENLDQLDRDFVALEAQPAQPERIDQIFRTIHTIKGTAGFLQFARLEELTHAGESLLSLLRDGTLQLTPELTSALLQMVDRVRVMLGNIESEGHEGQEPYQEVLEHLIALRSTVAPGGLPLRPSAGMIELWSEPPPADDGAATAADAVTASTPAEPERPPVAPSAPAPEPQASPSAPAEAFGAGLSGGAAVDSSVRVDVVLLDKLMNLVGELVLARNQIVQFGAQLQDARFVSASQRLNHVTTELQEHVMKTRMQPIGNVWSKLPRVVRDLAVSCGKQMRIEMFGKETELDRTILEGIKDPLTHAVRNAVDHGIELPEVRASLGKPKTGSLVLRAFHESGQVNIEISDDGGGLRLDAIRKKAIERGLITAERAAGLSERDLGQLIFLPGFSTAAQVTNVSGRGVGMDVVKTNVERIGGTVDLVSRKGLGTTLKIKIPLTLAIVPALIVTSAEQRYAIPQVNLLELVRMEAEQAKTSIERIRGAPVYRLRGRLLPLVSLNQQLQRGPGFAAADIGAANIVVLQADGRQFGLVVDDVRDTEEIVVKPLGKELKGLTEVFAGAAIMGDGRVALIIDVLGLAQHSGVVGGAREQGQAGGQRNTAGASEQQPGQERTALLVFTVGADTSLALPLAMVARLEEFPAQRLEQVQGRRVVQYRDEILPLIELSEPAAAAAGNPHGSVHVIVYSAHGRSVGFVVSRIVDVVEDVLRIDRAAAETGLLGAAVIGGKVMGVLDVEGVIRAHCPGFFVETAA